MTAPGTNASSSQASNPLNSPVTIPAVMFIFGVVGNLVAIVVLCKSRKEQKETTFYTLVCGLAVTMDCSQPGSSVHGMLQARILEWVAISFSRGSSQPKDQTLVSCIGRWIFFFFLFLPSPGKSGFYGRG